jgi:hypothetical protein
VDPGVLRDLQGEIRRGIQILREGRHRWNVKGPTQVGIARWGSEVRKAHRVGTFRTLFVAIAQEVIEARWPEMRSCPWCDQWFLRQGKQTFCSPECSRKRRWARYASRHRRRRDYREERERAIRKRLGARVRVGRKKRP